MEGGPCDARRMCSTPHLYHVNRGLGVVASCSDAAMPSGSVRKGYIWSEEMDAQGSDCCPTTSPFKRSVATITGCRGGGEGRGGGLRVAGWGVAGRSGPGLRSNQG